METERLVLRQWQPGDLEPFAALNADPDVMRYFPDTMTPEASAAAVDRIRAHLDENGWGRWAVERKDTGAFIGFIGLGPMPAGTPDGVEVAWRLAKDHWGRGYAPEGARAAVAYGFGELGLAEIVSMTTVTNRPSRRVMEKLGMTHNPADDFRHPAYPDWWGAPHVLHRLRKPAP